MRGYLGSGAISFMLDSGTASLLMLDLFFDSVNCSVVISLPFLFFNVGVDMIGLVFRSCAGAGAGIASSVEVGISVGRTSSFLLSIKNCWNLPWPNLCAMSFPNYVLDLDFIISWDNLFQYYSR